MSIERDDRAADREAEEHIWKHERAEPVGGCFFCKTEAEKQVQADIQEAVSDLRDNYALQLADIRELTALLGG